MYIGISGEFEECYQSARDTVISSHGHVVARSTRDHEQIDNCNQVESEI